MARARRLVIVAMARSGKKTPPAEYSLDQIDKLEELSIEKANKAISAIENAIAVWESSPEHPEDLKARVIRLKYFHDAMMDWEKKTLVTRGSPGAIGERVDRLKEFAEICLTYA